MPLYDVKNPLGMTPGSAEGGSRSFSKAIQGKQQQAAMAPPEKNVGGGIQAAMGGAGTAAGIGAAMGEGALGGTIGGPWGIAAGAALGAAGYLLS